MNKVIATARLTADAKTEQVGEKQTVKTTARIALIPNSKDGRAPFVDLVAWGKSGEFLAKYGKRGRRLEVEGELDYQEWEGSDGSKHSRHQIVTGPFQFRFLDKDGEVEDQAGEAQGE